MDILNALNQRMIKRNISFNEFAIFFIIFSIFPYLVWKDNSWSDAYILKFIAGSMCVMLLTKDIWSHCYRKYFSLLWYICVFTSLPLTHSMILFQNNIAEWALINFIFSVFVLSFLVDWDLFLIFLLTAIIIAILHTHIVLEFNLIESIGTTRGVWFLYSLFSSMAISFVFARKNEGFYNFSLNKANQAFGIIAHEIRNPLSTLQLLNANYSNQDHITDTSKTNFLHKANAIINDIFYILEDVLAKLQVDKKMSMKKLDLNQELMKIIDDAPFRNSDKSFIHLTLRNNIDIIADDKFLKFVILNILNNALFYKSQISNFKIKVYTELSESRNLLVIEDNGPGISEKDLSSVFNGFYTTKSNGTGLGMFFCKKVMLKFNGDIICESQLGSYTKFKLIFPHIGK